MPIKNLFEIFSNKRTHRRTISNILGAVSIPSYRYSLPRIKSEFYRVRRFQRQLAVVAIGVNGEYLKENIGKLETVSTDRRNRVSVSDLPKRISIAEFVLCGPIFYESLREIDIISYDWIHNQFLIFLPETDKQNASLMVDRIKKILRESINGQLSIGIAEFPKDGLTIDEIVQSAMNDFGKIFGAGKE